MAYILPGHFHAVNSEIFHLKVSFTSFLKPENIIFKTVKHWMYNKVILLTVISVSE